MADGYRSNHRPTYEEQRAYRERMRALENADDATYAARPSQSRRSYGDAYNAYQDRTSRARAYEDSYDQGEYGYSARDSYDGASRTRTSRASYSERAGSRSTRASSRATSSATRQGQARYSRSSYGSEEEDRSAHSRSSYRSGARSRSARSTDGGAPRPARASRDSGSRLTRTPEKTSKPFPLTKILIGVAAIVLIVFGVNIWSIASPITITINGTETSIRGAKTVQTAKDESGLPLNPGDLISLKGNILKKQAGEAFSATVNGEKVTDYNMKLKNGDKVVLKDGEDTVEPYDATQETIPHASEKVGVGSIHVFTNEGSDGIRETRTGQMSGEVVEKVTKEPENLVLQMYNIDPPNDKVIALTFDDGPHKDYTKEILDILDQYNVKATFFCVGENVLIDNNDELLRRAYNAGHQICTHTFDHARPAGSLNICLMSAEGQIDEIEHGRQVITDALGVEASRVVRLPGGSLDEATMLNIQPYITAEIGWNIDTADWTYPGAEAIADAMMYVERGDVILCHDGGGDRTDTAAALRIALPKLLEQGYRFVTIDELMTYPAYKSS